METNETNETNETIASWEKDCDCQGLSTMPSLRTQLDNQPFEKCSLTGSSLSLKRKYIHAPVCQMCHKEWRRTLSGNFI